MIVRQVDGGTGMQEMGFIYSNIGIAIWFRIQSAGLRSRAIPDVGSPRYNWNAANLKGKFIVPTPNSSNFVFRTTVYMYT